MIRYLRTLPGRISVSLSLCVSTATTVPPRRSLQRFLVIGLAALPLLCAEQSEATERYLASTVSSVYPQADGSFILKFTTDSTYCSSTASPKYYFVGVGQNGVTLDGAKAMLATALTAFAMGNSISIAFDDSTAYCYINRFSIF